MFKWTTNGAEEFSQIGHCSHPTALYGVPTTKPRIRLMALEESPQDLRVFSALQDQGQTSSRECSEAKSNCDYGSEKGLRKSIVSLA